MEVSIRDIPGTESAALLSFALVSELIEALKAKDVLTAGDVYDLHNRLARDLGQLPRAIGVPVDTPRAGRRLELRYDGFSHVVEVHAVGITDEGKAVMRVWQVRGGGQSSERTGWKFLRLDEASSANILDEVSEAPRSGYTRADKAMSSTNCQL